MVEDSTGLKGSEQDIIKKEEEKEKLKGSEEMYRLIAETSIVGICITNEKGIFTFVNDTFAKMFGYSKEEMLKLTNCLVLISPQLLEKAKENLVKASSGESIRDEIACKKKTGEEFVISFHSTPIMKNGKFTGINGVLVDITNQKKAEEELKLHSEIMKNLSEGVYIIETDSGIIKYTNPKLEKMFGYDPGEMVGKHVSIVNAPTDKDPKETAEEIIGVLEKTGEWHGEVNNIKKDGATFWCYANVSDFDHPIYGKVWVSIHTDITEKKKAEGALKESEKRFRQFFENGPTYCYMISPDGKVLDVNKIALDVLGYTKSELVNKSLKEIYAPESYPKIEGNIREWKKTGRLKNIEMVILTKSGERRTVLLSADTVKSESGEILHSISVQNDITERKKAEAKLKKYSEQLKKYAKKLEKRVGELEGRQIELNEKEKSVLCALVNYPGFNDLQLAEVTRLKRSTITAIRNRLKENNWYRKINIPNLEILGCDVLSFVYCNSDKFDKRVISSVCDYMKKSPECFFSHVSDSFFFAFHAYPNLQETNVAIRKALLNSSFQDLVGEIKVARFYLPSSYIVRFLDYSNILSLLFGIEFEKVRKMKVVFNKKLNENEKELLYIFTKYPEINNERVCKFSYLSKPTIIKIKKKLFGQGFLRPVIIPNMKKLGFSYSSFIYQNLNRPIYSKKPSIIKTVNKSKNTYFSIIGEEQFLIASVFRDRDELRDVLLKKRNMLQNLFGSLEGPKIFSYSDPKRIKLDFSSLVKKIFSLDVNY